MNKFISKLLMEMCKGERGCRWKCDSTTRVEDIGTHKAEKKLWRPFVSSIYLTEKRRYIWVKFKHVAHISTFLINTSFGDKMKFYRKWMMVGYHLYQPCVVGYVWPQYFNFLFFRAIDVYFLSYLLLGIFLILLL